MKNSISADPDSPDLDLTYMNLSEEQIEAIDWGDGSNVEQPSATHVFATDTAATHFYVSIPDVSSSQLASLAGSSYAKSGSGDISEIYLGDNITTFDANLTMTSISTIYGGAKLAKIYNEIFLDEAMQTTRVSTLYLKTTTPPEYIDSYPEGSEYAGMIHNVIIYVPAGSESAYEKAWSQYIERGEIIIKPYDAEGIFLFNYHPSSGSSIGDGTINQMTIYADFSVPSAEANFIGIEFGGDISGSGGDELLYIEDGGMRTTAYLQQAVTGSYWIEDQTEYRVIEVYSNIKEVQQLFKTYNCGIQLF